MKKFHVKIFSSSWVKYSHLLPYSFNGKNISCVKFSSLQAADENFLTANFSQTTVYSSAADTASYSYRENPLKTENLIDQWWVQ